MTGKDVEARLRIARDRIGDAQSRAGLSGEVTLVAITKTVSPDRILEAYRAGQCVFGENRVQEAISKVALLAETAPAPEWHLVGHLQTNKARVAAERFAMIQSVDSIKLAHRLQTEAERLSRDVPILLEINVAGEASKSGFSPEAALPAMDEIMTCHRLRLMGLMTVAPLVEQAGDARWVFARMRAMREELRERFDLSHFDQLSMGMSDDFEVAVEEGATIVRLGRALFGDRPTSK
ncbi:MAG: YggS family pyridoxal phosphate-dependent enzyme [Chloroflexota bacterium]|nr:MAG: YggS family pyridoxal phosphate-dependent enzyme [Chloroflexota bacterium]